MKLTTVERWILANQFKILARVDPDEARYYEKCEEVVSMGYELNYDWISQNIDRETLPEEACREVLDILQMFLTLSDVYTILKDKDGITKDDVAFRGFDANNEDGYLAYAQFLQEKENKFTSLKINDSHMPYLSKYRRMLGVWKGLRDRYEMSKDDLLRVVKA